MYPGATFRNLGAACLTIEGFAKPATPNHTAQRYKELVMETSCEYCALLINGDRRYIPKVGIQPYNLRKID